MQDYYKNIACKLMLLVVVQPYAHAMEQSNQEQLDKQLYDATANKSLNTILSLIKKGANVNAEHGDLRTTPLDVAIRNPRRGVVEALIAARAQVNRTNTLAETPLQHAVVHERAPIVRLLLEAGAQTHAPLMPIAMMRFARSDFDVLDIDASNLLDILQLLIHYGISINSKNSSGDTALELVAKYFRNNEIAASQVIAFLLEHGATINPQNAQLLKIIAVLIGLPLNTAAATGNLEAVTNILQALPPEVRAENIALQQDEPLTLTQRIMTRFPSLRVCFSSQRRCVNINKQDQRGFTALHWAAAQGHPQIVHALLQAGANFRIANDEHLTPLQLAERNLLEARQRGDSEAERRYQEIIDSINSFCSLKTTKEILAQAFRTLPREQARRAYGEFDPEEFIKLITAQMLRPPAVGSASHAP